jgi:hypothetical protein
MHGKMQVYKLLWVIWIPFIVSAQQTGVTYQDLEEMFYGSESAFIPETLFGDEDEPGFPQMDLNTSSVEELEATGLFTPYQLYNLVKYREEYGEIFSIYEILLLPGFNPSNLPDLEPFLTAEQSDTYGNKKPLRHMVLIDLGQTLSDREGYKDGPDGEPLSNYAGSPLKTIIRFQSHPKYYLSMALTWEKDAGERLLFQNRPQFLSGYISYSGERSLKKLVVGNFKMNQGVGLVNGDGFLHQAGKLKVNRMSLSQISPYASKTENMFEQGIACQLELKKIELLFWASCRRLSLSPSAFTDSVESDKWLDYERTSGLFRTPGELEGRELAFRVHMGTQALYRFRQLTLGMMSGTEWIYPTKKAMENYSITPGPSIQQKASLHGNWQKNQMQIFGELAFSDYQSMAWLIGTKYYFSDFILGSLLIHSYGNEYRGSYPSSYGSGSNIKNEQGVTLYMHAETGKFLTADLTVGLFLYPFPRYLTVVPSNGYKLDFAMYSPGKKTLQWRLRVVNKTWQTTPVTETNKLRILQDFRVTRVDGQTIYNYQDLFKWQTRLVISYYSRQPDQVPGFAAMQQISIHFTRILKATAQIVLFKVTDWENRIYMYEPGLYYSFSFPAYYGSGQKTTILFTLKPVHQITLSAKISGMINNGSRKWETGIQLRLNF